MSPRPNVSEARKQQIINAAEEVFTQKGLDEARMDDIAEETGLSKGTLYLYFKSKDDLIIAILDRLFQREFAELEKIDQADKPAIENIQKFIVIITHDLKAMLRLMPIAYEFLSLAFRNKYVQHALRQYLDRYMHALVPMIQRGIDSGEFRAVSARDVALAAGAIIEGTLLLWVYDQSQLDPIRQIPISVQLLFEGILASPPSETA